MAALPYWCCHELCYNTAGIIGGTTAAITSSDNNNGSSAKNEAVDARTEQTPADLLLDPVGFAACESDPIRGNTLGAAASWGGGVRRVLSEWSGRNVSLEVVVVAAKLFSLQFNCSH